MNFETRMDHEKKLRTHIVRGEVGLPAVQSFLESVYAEESFDPQCHAVWDVREAIFPDPSPGEIKDLAAVVRQHWAIEHRRKVAVVVAGDFYFGLSRMFEQFVGLSPHTRLRTFREMPPALDWIEDRMSGSPMPLEL